MYWLYFDLREQLLDQRMRIEQGEYLIQKLLMFIRPNTICAQSHNTN